MKFVCFVLVLIISFGAAACGPRKPAYSDIDPAQGVKSDNRNSSGQAMQPINPGSGEAQPPGGQTPPAAPQTAAFRMPEFIDQNTGMIKDLPSYPNSLRQNIQYGPMQDQDKVKDTMSLLLATPDAMDKIAAFYEKVVKSNGWTVTDKLRDPELSQWVLKKGDDNEAKIEVRKDPNSNTMFIALARTQTQPQPKQ